MRITTFIVLLFLGITSYGQKKPLDHSVYDGWQNIAERLISDDGKFIAFTVTPQEGDGLLYIKKKDGSNVAEIARGYNANITDNSRFLICRIKPFFKDTREAKIKKKRPEEMPKDSLAVVDLLSGKITKVAQVKSFKIADEQAVFLAYHLEKKPVAQASRAPQSDSATKPAAPLAPPTPRAAAEPFEEGTDLVVHHLLTGDTVVYNLVSEYFFNKKGNILLLETTKKTGDTKVKPQVIKVDLVNKKSSIVLTGFNDAKGYRMDELGNQLAFIAERDSSAKSLQKFYKLFYHKNGADSAVLLVQKNTSGMPANFTLSENAQAISFSKSGSRLFFGTAPILPVKDTLTPDFERVSVDVWHYKDDYLQPLQLRNLQQELNKAYLARFDFDKGSVVQIGSPAFRNIIQTNEGDGAVFYGVADEGKRIASQWQGASFSDIYAINPLTDSKQLILANIKGNIYPSSTGKYLVIYDEVKKKYSAYNSESQKMTSIAADIKLPLYDIENDVPDDPNAYGLVGWIENDESLLIYDQFDIWQIDPLGTKSSINITGGLGRKNNLVLRNITLDREARFIKKNQTLLLNVFNQKNKGSGLKTHVMGTLFEINASNATLPTRISAVSKAKEADVISFGTETFQRSSNIAVIDWKPNSILQDVQNAPSLHQPNPQQANYNWGSAELFTWKAYTGKIAEGIVYKPEDFDPKKKYPMIAYFYERSSDGLYGYSAPAPTPSRLNIPFFVSRGYIVFVPDIWYKTGYPGQSAYDYIVSGTRALVAKGYVDSTKLGLQGQSWGGYQIAHLITRTNLYAAAWAGAPVANMTSAYGGIRWGTGLNRQFQYEKTQSRIGATLWEKPNLYIENSPLFYFPKVKTPVVIMHNDADGAVPWYQGIEMFTALRRLGKPVWMLNYNNEDHNLVERRNRKDIQIREQQFFDYLLKGDKPAKWIAEGVPAILKGRDWGLGY
ncbi:MAG: alpha/beta hydrolase family protein [Sediminibacterium sp.]